jgi:hypothetical protein
VEENPLTHLLVQIKDVPHHAVEEIWDMITQYSLLALLPSQVRVVPIPLGCTRSRRSAGSTQLSDGQSLQHLICRKVDTGRPGAACPAAVCRAHPRNVDVPSAQQTGVYSSRALDAQASTDREWVHASTFDSVALMQWHSGQDGECGSRRWRTREEC